MLVSNFIDQFRKYLEEVKFPILAKKRTRINFIILIIKVLMEILGKQKIAIY